MIDLDQLTNELSEGEEVILQNPPPHIDIDSDEDMEDESEDNLESKDEERRCPFTPIFSN